MKPSRFNSHISYLLLVLFLAMKLTGIHTVSHTDDANENDSCSICYYAAGQNLVPIIAADTYDAPEANFSLVIERRIINNYNYFPLKSFIPRASFSRPPPFKL